jgi:hypothetical protein
LHTTESVSGYPKSSSLAWSAGLKAGFPRWSAAFDRLTACPYAAALLIIVAVIAVGVIQLFPITRRPER